MTSTSKLPQSKLSQQQQLWQWMRECRAATLALFENVDEDTFRQQAHPDLSPIGWHLGHIAYTEYLWLLEHLAGLPPQSPHYRRLFAADGLPKSERGRLSRSEIYAYLDSVRSQVFDYLETALILEHERLWCWLLQHESQHCETIAIVLALQKQDWGIDSGKPNEHSTFSIPTSTVKTPSSSDMVRIPAGSFVCGSDTINALDNERPPHRVPLETYWIDRVPVTGRSFRAFIDAGGYHTSRWWSPEGWAWCQSAQIEQPRYWRNDSAWDNHPVCGVSWYEADAYARWVGKRLPTEAEWEAAARWNPLAQQHPTDAWGESDPMIECCNYGHRAGWTTPVDRDSAYTSPSGCVDLLGNVWEWTATWFDGYSGFDPYPYRGYSQAYFDGQHRVLKGGSWATPSWGLRASFRNWYHPHVREMFAGFRCATNG